MGTPSPLIFNSAAALLLVAAISLMMHARTTMTLGRVRIVPWIFIGFALLFLGQASDATYARFASAGGQGILLVAIAAWLFSLWRSRESQSSS